MRRRVLRWGIVVAALAMTIGVGIMLARPRPPVAPVAPAPTALPARAPVPSVPVTRNFAVPVLMYHRIGPVTPEMAHNPLLRSLTVTPEAFAAQIQYLVDHRFTVVTSEQVVKAVLGGTPLPERAVAITIDDGYEDNYAEALPILHRYGVPATVFVVLGAVGTPDHLDWSQMATMTAEGIDIESHTVTHSDLTMLPPTTLHQELALSRTILAQRLGHPISQLAYPSGTVNDQVVSATRSAGYLAAWDRSGGPVRSDANPYRLPRMRVPGEANMRTFAGIVLSGLRARGTKSSVAGASA